MKYMLLIYTDEKVWTESEREKCIAESTQLTHELHAKKQYLGASPLHPVAAATSVRVRDGRRLVTDGPFAETKEILAGFNLIEAEDMDEAVRIASEFPWAETGSIEVRPIRDFEAVRNRVGASREKEDGARGVEKGDWFGDSFGRGGRARRLKNPRLGRRSGA